MKFTILFLFVMLTTVGFSQNDNKQTTQLQTVAVESGNTQVFYIDSAKLAKKNNFSKTEKFTVAYYDNYINAIETKIEYVKNDPIEHKKALKSGWYDQFEKYLQKAKADRELLISSTSHK